MKVKQIKRSRRKWLWKRRRNLQTKLWRMTPWGSENKTNIENEIYNLTKAINQGFEITA